MAAACAALLLVGMGLAGCGDKAAEDPAETAETSEQAETPAQESESEAPTEEEGENPSPNASAQQLPADWPERVKVPDGTIALVLPIGKGYKVLIEGVDNMQTQDKLSQMLYEGFDSAKGVVSLGGGAWVAELTDAEWMVAYSYESGGAGQANVTITLTPKA